MAQNSNYVTVDGEFDSLEDRSFLTIDDYDLSGQSVILRIDINSSINPENGDLLDDTRIKRHSATVKELSDKGARIIILAHQSRPGKLDFVNLEKHGERMSQIIDKKVKFINDLYAFPFFIDSLAIEIHSSIFLPVIVCMAREELATTTFC